MGKHITVRKVTWLSVGTFVALSMAAFINVVGNPYRIMDRGDQACVVHYFTETCYDKIQTFQFGDGTPPLEFNDVLQPINR